MLTPLSISPYNSRFTLDIDLADKIYNNTYEYVNMIYHGFYGGTSLQSQELNELQENIQNQLSLANILSGNWLEYPKTTVPDVENYTVHTDIFPVDPQGITFVNNTSSTLNLSKGYYLYPTEWGNIVFVSIPEQNNIFTSTGDLYTGISFSNILPRTVSGLQTEWNTLRDNDNDPFNNIGSRRIQLFLNLDTTIPTTTPTQRSQIYAVSWYPISGNVLDWSVAGGTNEVLQFSHVKPSVSLMMNGTTLFDYGNSPFPGSDFEQACVDNLLPGAIRRQLRMLEDNNNLSNTNIKNIIPHRYDSGTLFSGSLIWPTEAKMLQFKNDWIEVLNRIDGGGANPDGLLIKNTRLLTDQESYAVNNNFNITPTSYNTITSSPNYTLPLYDTPSLFSQMNGITWNGQGTAFCGDGCGFNSDYQVWNKSVEKIGIAAFSQVFLKSFKDRYGVDARASNWECNITKFGDGYPSEYGHDSYHDNMFGDSANIVLYGWESVISSEAWCLVANDDTRLKRIDSLEETAFQWHNNPWNAFMVNVQGVRSVKRSLMDRGLPNTSINAWIPAKDRVGWGDITTGDALNVGFVNSKYYDEMVRHASLTGIEFFAFFNDEFRDPITEPNGIAHKAKRIEQFTVINDILVDINDKLDGYTPISLDTTRISYNSEYVISGAPKLNGKFLWRVTPKRENNIIILANGSVANKAPGEIGVWITTDTATAPIISIQDADMHQYFSRVAFDGGRQNQRDWGVWGNKTIAMYNGTRLEANNSLNSPQSRPFGAFSRNPNGVTSSSWHNIIYELTYPIFKWGNRSILYQFPFGGFRIDNQFNGEPQYGEEGPVAGYMRFKDLYPGDEGTSDTECSARWKGMKEAFNDVINGKLTPTESYPAIDKPCNIVIYLPGFMGWATYREETCKYWEDLSTTGNDERNTAFYKKLDSYINDIIYIQKNGTSSTGVKGRLYVGIDTAGQSATPQSISAYQSISKTESALDVPGAAYTKFGYKAKNPALWNATNGGYRTDKLELADWYVKTKLEQAGISVLAEARPASSITQVSIHEVSGGVYRGNTTTPLPVTSWGNFASVESTMWTSRTYTAANEKFDEILRWPSNSFEAVHNTVNPEGNVFNLPSKISVLAFGVTYEKLHYPGWNAVPLVYSPFYYLHTLNALVDHIKYNDKHNASVVDRTDIQLNHKNIITLETSLYANNLDIPFANDSEGSTKGYYIWNKDTMGVSSYYAEPRELFEIEDFVGSTAAYNGGLWTSGATGNKEYWDNTFRSASFGEFVNKIRTISTQVSPPVGISNGVITYATGFTFSTTYPNDIYSRNMLRDIVGATVSDSSVEAAYGVALNRLADDCAGIILRFQQQP